MSMNLAGGTEISNMMTDFEQSLRAVHTALFFLSFMLKNGLQASIVNLFTNKIQTPKALKFDRKLTFM